MSASKLRAVVLCGLLAFSASALADNLIRTKAMGIINDPATGGWYVTCDLSVRGVDPHGLYGGVMLFSVAPTGNVFDATFQVSPSQRTYLESSPGIYSFTAKLTGTAIVVHAQVLLTNWLHDEPAGCDARIDQGTEPAQPGQELFGADNLVHLEEY